jgi:hypothetical protein
VSRQIRETERFFAEWSELPVAARSARHQSRQADFHWAAGKLLASCVFVNGRLQSLKDLKLNDTLMLEVKKKGTCHER